MCWCLPLPCCRLLPRTQRGGHDTITRRHTCAGAGLCVSGHLHVCWPPPCPCQKCKLLLQPMLYIIVHSGRYVIVSALAGQQRAGCTERSVEGRAAWREQQHRCAVVPAESTALLPGATPAVTPLHLIIILQHSCCCCGPPASMMLVSCPHCQHAVWGSNAVIQQHVQLSQCSSSRQQHHHPAATATSPTQGSR
jgi:hypothetical protein